MVKNLTSTSVLVKQYKVDIWKDNAFLCNVEIAITHPDKFLQIVLERFPNDEGFKKKVLIAKSEKRILESSAEGMRVLASLIDYAEVTTNDLGEELCEMYTP